MPYGYSYEHQSAWMSKITNDSLTWSGTACFIAVPYGNSGRQKVKDEMSQQHREGKLAIRGSTSMTFQHNATSCDNI